MKHFIGFSVEAIDFYLTQYIDIALGFFLAVAYWACELVKQMLTEKCVDTVTLDAEKNSSNNNNRLDK